MKPQRGFTAERALAQHCAELLRPPPPCDELLGRLDSAAALLAEALAEALTPLLGHDRPQIACEPVAQGDGQALRAGLAPLAAFSLLQVGPEKLPVLVASDGAAVLRMVDRAFGGRGTAPDPLPDTLPLSAELMIARLETIFIAALDAAWRLGGADAVTPAGRSSDLGALAEFPADADLAILRLSVTEASGLQWPLALALPVAAIPGLTAQGPRSRPAGEVRRSLPNPADQPYGQLPLTLRAVLVDMALPVSAVARLVPGQVLPVSVARNVPLRIGRQTIAHGTIGALDEQVAVQISSAF